MFHFTESHRQAETTRIYENANQQYICTEKRQYLRGSKQKVTLIKQNILTHFPKCQRSECSIKFFYFQWLKNCTGREFKNQVPKYVILLMEQYSYFQGKANKL